jgi:hypothetical protein
MRAERAPWSWMRAALLALALLVSPPALMAQDATWLPGPGSGDFNDPNNWSPASVPIGTATFGFSTEVNLATSYHTTLQGFTFNVGASTYTLTNDFDLKFIGAGIVINGGGLIYQRVRDDRVLGDEHGRQRHDLQRLHPAVHGLEQRRHRHHPQQLLPHIFGLELGRRRDHRQRQ